MIGFPFDSHVEYGEDGLPNFDRAVTSGPMRKLISKLFSDGVLPNPATNLQVIANGGMKIKVKAGFCIVKGLMKLEEFDRVLTLRESDRQYDRIDSVVMRLDTNDKVRACELYIVQGNASHNPTRPRLTREGSIYEIGLADIFVGKGSSRILPDKITDTRYEVERCGIISSVSEFDTSEIYNQINADLKYFKNVSEQDFLNWFTDVKATLDENVAGNLKNQIDANKEALTISPETIKLYRTLGAEV